MVDNFSKIIRLGTTPAHDNRRMDVFCKIEFTDGNLSITGVEGPRRSGNCKGGCGQIVMSMDDDYLATLLPAKGWSRRTARQFVDTWNRWHLNDMVAGSPRQTAFLRTLPEYPGYEKALHLLKDAGLSPDHEHDDYRYGSAWLREEIPADIVEFLAALPDTDKTPAWV